MNIADLSIKEIEGLFASDNVTEALVEACRNDKRAAAAKIIKRYERKQAEIARVKGMFRYEDEARAEGYSLIAGVDEAGRGPLAGPVSVAAVILPEGLIFRLAFEGMTSGSGEIAGRPAPVPGSSR